MLGGRGDADPRRRQRGAERRPVGRRARARPPAGRSAGPAVEDVDLDAGTLVVMRAGCARSGGTAARRRAITSSTTTSSSDSAPGGDSRDQVTGWTARNRPPDPLVALLRRHREQQDHERADACDVWQDRATSSPPRRDGRSTRAPTTPSGNGCSTGRGCRSAGFTTHGTPPPLVLLLLSVTEQTVMSVMGWSSTAMAA